MPSIHANRGAKRARIARVELGLAPDQPLADVVADIERAGELHVVVLDLGDGVAGAYVHRPGCPLIFVNGRHGVARQRFTVAHEFGHHRLGHRTVVDRSAALTDTGHDPREVEANAFASEFLIPRAALERVGLPARRVADLELEHVVRVAYAFGVSAEVARYRLGAHGVLSASRQDALDAAIADHRHLDLAERLDLTDHADTLSAAADGLPRVPDGLRAGAFGQFLAGGIDAATLAGQLGQPLTAVQQMLGNLGLGALAASSPAPR